MHKSIRAQILVNSFILYYVFVIFISPNHLDLSSLPILFLLVRICLLFFFFNDTAPPEISTLSLHDPLPISLVRRLLEATRHPLPRGEREPWPERHRTRHAPPCGKPRTPLRSGSPRRAARDPGRRSGIASPRRPPCRPAVRRR